MEKLYNLMAMVPTWLWIVIGICVVFPIARVAIKKSAKLLGVLAIVLALLFMFPSIGSAIMGRVGLTYDSETHSITNRNGTTISINSISDLFSAGDELGETAKDLYEQAKDAIDGVTTDINSKLDDKGGATLSLSELQKEIDSISKAQGKAEGSQDKKLDVSGEEITITKDTIKSAKNLGLNIDKNTKIVTRGHKYYMILKDGNEIELSAEIIKSLGIK